MQNKTGTNEQTNTDILDPCFLSSIGLRRSTEWKPNSY